MHERNLGHRLVWLMSQGSNFQSRSLLPKEVVMQIPEGLSIGLTGSAKLIQFKKDEKIFHTGQIFTNLYFLARGFVKADCIFRNGHYQTNRFIIPGDWFGLKALGCGHYQSTTTTLTDCDVVAVNALILGDQMNQNVTMRNTFEAIRSSLMNQLAHHCVVLSTYSVSQKLAHFLIDFQERLRAINCDSPIIELPMSRDDLKSYLGTTKESLSRAFTGLEKSGCFKFKNRMISEIDFELLQKVADGEVYF